MGPALGSVASAQQSRARNAGQTRRDQLARVPALERGLIATRSAVCQAPHLLEDVAVKEAGAHLDHEADEHQDDAGAARDGREPLRPAEITLRTIFDATPDAIVVLRLANEESAARDGEETDAVVARFVDINRGFENQFGLTRQEVIGRKFGELGVWIDTEARNRIERELLERHSIDNMEAELHHKDGHAIPCLLSGTLIVVGKEQYVVAMARNISELKEAQRRLQQSEETFRKLFDANLDAMSITDLHTGRFIDVNKEFERRTGYSRAEMIGMRSRDFDAWVDPGQSVQLADGLRQRGEVRNMEVLYRNKDGEIGPRLLSATLLELQGHWCCLTITRDISVLKAAEQQLIEAREAALSASRAKSDFLSSMSHEIRTPMNAVLGMADLLAETKLDDEQRKYLNTMINNGNVLLELINDILDLAKVEAGHLELERTAFDLDDLTDRVGETLAIRAHTKHLELVSHVVPGVPSHLIGDPLRVRQILLNLIGNAIKFTESGSVVLTVEQEAVENGTVMLHFSVADSGIGIPAGKIDGIFESFTQADSSTTRRFGGSGLGLAIVKRLVELMGGRVWVESEVGRGSTFHFTARFDVQSDAAHQPAAPADSLDLAGVRTLIVDDTPINRVILREMLGARGALITEATSGEEALARLHRALRKGQPFELLVLDRRMPGMDGLEVAQRIKADDGGRIVTLMLTSDDFSIGAARLRELGIHAYLVKPIRRTELYEAIAAAMAKVKSVQAGGPAVPMRQTTPPPQNALGSALRILLAEDSPDNRMLIEAYLRNTQHRLETADNGEVALLKFKSGRYDLVLMDMQMPVMDGYRAVREIRNWEIEHAMRPVAIIALTADALKEDARRSLEAGCDAHVAKPVKKAVLLDAIRTVAEARRVAGENPPLEAERSPF
jgi:two-component system, sensor histidine kinase and response regulator